MALPGERSWLHANVVLTLDLTHVIVPDADADGGWILGLTLTPPPFR
jgi:hypothetical protein